jgi:peptidoglycan-associated lipoprotein
MKHPLTTLLIFGSIAVLASGCVATRNFVREHVGATETRIGQRVDTTDTQLKATADKTAANAQAIEATGQKLAATDARVGEVGSVATEARTLAGDAKKDAATVANSLRESDTRYANRNNYSKLDEQVILFAFDKAAVQDSGFGLLDEIAKALKANPNAVVELQGYADPRGSDRYNYQLTRDRVDAVTRYLVQKHGIDLRRIHAVGMGKAEMENGSKRDREAMSKARRVEIRILAPQS